jgi:hypothetical protein
MTKMAVPAFVRTEHRHPQRQPRPGGCYRLAAPQETQYMDQEAKAKLASRLSSALHQAPDHPENFANVLRKQLATHGMHISDLRITFGDID